MKINTDIDLQGIITSTIPAAEKLMLINIISRVLRERHDWLAKVLHGQTSQEMIGISNQLDVLSHLSAAYTDYLNNN